MKKCVFCETKKLREKQNSASRFLARCTYCTSRNKLAEDRNAKIMQAKRSEILEKWIGGTGY